jgi:hypothetical protein
MRETLVEPEKAMEPNRVHVRHNNMSTESVSDFRADPVAVSALGQVYRDNAAILSAQVAEVVTAAAALHPDALGSVGSVFAKALADAAGRHADRVAEAGARLGTAEHTAATSAASFVDADGRVEADLEALR